MNDDKWIGFLLLGMIIYTGIMVYLFEYREFIGFQINFSIIIALLVIIIIKHDKR